MFPWYFILGEIKYNSLRVLFHCCHFISGGKITCNQYPTIRLYERKRLLMRISRKCVIRISFHKISVVVIPNTQSASISQPSFQSAHSSQWTKLNNWKSGKVLFSDIQLIISGFFYFALLLLGMKLRPLNLRRFHQKPCHLIKLQIASFLAISGRKINIARKKGKTLLKGNLKVLEGENTVHHRMNQMVIVTKIHQTIQILTMVHHKNLQWKKCFNMSIPPHDSLPSFQRKRTNGSFVNNWKSSLKPNF